MKKVLFFILFVLMSTNLYAQSIGGGGIYGPGAGAEALTYSMPDAANVAATRSTKVFMQTLTLAADANDVCGGTADCLTLPTPTTMGVVEIWTSASDYYSAVVVAAGTSTLILDSGVGGIEYQAAVGDCSLVCLHDGGANAVIFNDTAGAVTVTVRFVYD